MNLNINSWSARLEAKTITLCLAALALILSTTLSTNLAANQPDNRPRILVLGDSLSAAYNIAVESGWVHLLGMELAPEYEVINASVSGETTGGGRARLAALLREHEPDWVVIELGGNDGLRGFPLKIIRENLVAIGDMVKASGGEPIYLGIEIPPNYGPRYANAFAKIFEEVAESHSAAYLNLFMESFYNEDDLLQNDGIHPTAKAQPLIRDHVKQFLVPILTEAR